MTINQKHVDKLNKLLGESKPENIILKSIEEFNDKVVYVCSFGTESAIILHMISKINKNFPIILLNTNFLFFETICYKEELLKKFNLKNCKEIFPNKNIIKKKDPDNELWKSNINKCCDLRKVKPLQKELKYYDSWISGRKSYHLGLRVNLKPFEIKNEKIVINPLANFGKEEVNNYFLENKIPRHPLFNQGYLSIGCTHCTSKAKNKDDVRSGRWENLTKTECGIHLEKKI